MPATKKITVYCSGKDNLPQRWQQGAIEVGTMIGRAGAQLVYGGVDSGLMRVVAHAAHDAGATIVGIVPSRRKDLASPLNNIYIPTGDLSDRKGILQMLGDAFIVLPGGYGTIDEFLSTFSNINFTGRNVPIIVFNPDGVFDNILAQLRHTAALGLMAPTCLNIITETNTVEQLTEALGKILSDK